MERWVGSEYMAGFSLRGKTTLAFYEGTLDAPAYQNTLQKKLLPAAQEWYEDENEGWELQQDKASCHTAKFTEGWLEQYEVAVVKEWPTKGDDINPIENLWAILDDRLENEKKIRQLWMT